MMEAIIAVTPSETIKSVCRLIPFAHAKRADDRLTAGTR